jgi:glycosyltransferase involved in cell wall biosynthesis
MKNLSIIMPFVNEYPQVMFTIQSIAQELIGRLEFEIIAVDNYCGPIIKTAMDKELKQDDTPDKGRDAVSCTAGRHNPWLKYIKFDKKLSHWNAKRVGVNHAEGEVLWFTDAHVVVSRDGLYNMFRYYTKKYDQIEGTMHMPLTYKILESTKLIYKLVTMNAEKKLFLPDHGWLDYSFTRFRHESDPYEVPCMSCCGVMISKEIYDKLGGWPKALGIYSGGEHFLNFGLATMGYKKWIYPRATLYHYGEGRGYSWEYDDYVRNRMLASYIYGGEEYVTKFEKYLAMIGKGKPEVLKMIKESVILAGKGHREIIKPKQVISPKDWALKWVKK